MRIKHGSAIESQVENCDAAARSEKQKAEKEKVVGSKADETFVRNPNDTKDKAKVIW